jgi:hypothetical protein
MCATPAPYIGTPKGGKWTGTYFDTHAQVITWYSPDMLDWLKSSMGAVRRSQPARAEPH